jgi:hypothetical protein
MYPYIMQGKNVTIVVDGESYTISEDHINYRSIIEAIKTQDWASIPDLVSPAKAVVNYANGNVTINDGVVTWRGIPMHNSLSDRMVSMLTDGFPIEPLVNFMDNLMNNPSARAVNELYGFLEKCSLPITPDGCFIAYKKVNRNFTDCHTGQVLNKPAALLTEDERNQMPMNFDNGVQVTVVDGVTSVSMPRNLVDDERDRTCSKGLHFCSREYLQSFGGDVLLAVKVNPADVVSIPSDYNDSKGRTSRYYIDRVIETAPETIEEKSVYGYDDDEYDSDYDDAYDDNRYEW